MEDRFIRSASSKLDGFGQFQAAAPSSPQPSRESPRKARLVPPPVRSSSSAKDELGQLSTLSLPPSPVGAVGGPRCKQGTGQAEYCTACFMTGIRPLQSCLQALLAPVVQVPHAATASAQWRALCSGLCSKRTFAGLVLGRSSCSDEQIGNLLNALLASQNPAQLQLLELDSLSQASQRSCELLASFLLRHPAGESVACLRLTSCERMFTASRAASGGFSLIPSEHNVLPSAPTVGSSSVPRRAPQSGEALQGRVPDAMQQAAQMDDVGFLRPIVSHTKPSFVDTGSCVPAGTQWPRVAPRALQCLPPPASARGRKSKGGAKSTPNKRQVGSSATLSRGGGLQLSQLEPEMLRAVQAAEAATAQGGRKQGGKRSSASSSPQKRASSPRAAEALPVARPHTALHPVGVLTHVVARRCAQLSELDISNNKLSSNVAASVIFPPLLVPESQVYASLATLNCSWNSIGGSAVLLCFLLLNKRLTADSIAAFAQTYLPPATKQPQGDNRRGQGKQRRPAEAPPQASTVVPFANAHAVAAVSHALRQAHTSAVAWSAACAAVDLTASAPGSMGDDRAVQHALQRAALAADLSQAGRFNSSLAYLELSMCAIDDATGALLMHCACNSETLRSLDLSHNALGAQAAAAAEKLVVNSTSLLSLDLGFNPLGWEGTVRLVQALQANDSVVELSVENTLVKTQFHASADGSVPKAWHLPHEAAGAPPGGAAAGSPRGKRGQAKGRPASVESKAQEVAVDDDEQVPTPPSHSEAYQMLHEICTSILSRRGTYAQVNFEYPPQHRLMGTFRYAHLTRSASGRWLGLQAERGGGDWSLQRSVWRPRLLECDSRAFYDTQSIMNRAFEADVHCSKLDRMLKDPEQLSNVKVKLRRRFPALRELFRYYCCSGGSAASGIDPFSMSFQQFTEWRRDSGIEATNLTQHLDMAFIAANSSLPGKGAGDPTASDRRLRRHEFLEAVVRTAMVMFPPDMNDPNGPAASVSQLMEHHVLPTVASLLNVTDPSEPWSNTWRRTRLYTQSVDRVLKLYLPTLREIFDRCSRTVNTNELTHLTSAGFAINTKQRAARAHEESTETQRLYRKRFLFLEPFISLVQSAGCMKSQTGSDASSLYHAWLARKSGKQQSLEGQAAADKAAEMVFTKRDAMSVFVFSSMTVVSEVQRDLRSCRRCLHNSLTFTGFLEAVARLADSSACPAPSDVTGGSSTSKQRMKSVGSTLSSKQPPGSLERGRSAAGSLLPLTQPEGDMDLADAVSVATSGGDSVESVDPSTPPEELHRRLPLIITMLARGAQVPIQLSSNLED